MLLLTPFTVVYSLDKADLTLAQVYGTIGTACSGDTDLDTANANRVTLTAGRRYVIYCHDKAGAGIACECLQGGSTVDATAAVGITLFAGEKMIVKATGAASYISCVPFVDNQQMDACPLD